MKILPLSDTTFTAAAQEAAAVLVRGSILIYPTDTVYGLGVDALNDKAVEKLRTVKGRDSAKPFLLVVSDVDSIEKYAVLNDSARKLADRFLPGPLSLILPAKPNLPASLTLNGTIGIRVPDNEFCLELARTFGRPFISTSANVSGRETLSTISGIIEQLGRNAQEIELAIDDGEKSGGKPSTTVLCITDMPQILRQGAIPREELGI